ncbi:TPA: ABC transporter permease [Candidatus Poribacteria bacterium]|nr:ABC transporter permease [Candidatus Poribacteria bacterium]
MKIKLVSKILNFRESGIIAALMTLVIFTAVFNPRFLSGFNLQILSRQIALFSLLAIGETFVIITAGIDLSPGSVVVLTSVLVAWFMAHGFGFFGAILATLVISMGIGIWHALFVSKLRVPPFIITLGTFAIGRGLAAVITKGPPIPIPDDLSASFSYLWDGMILKILPLPLLILIIVSGIAIFILHFTVLGRYIYAVGGNIEAARLSGINVDKVRFFVYAVGALLAGVVGILIAARLRQGNPNVGQIYELYAIAAAVIGGTSLFGGVGTILGAIVGACILSTLWNSLILLRVSSYWHNVALGIVIVVAVTVDILRKRRYSR